MIWSARIRIEGLFAQCRAVRKERMFEPHVIAEGTGGVYIGRRLLEVLVGYLGRWRHQDSRSIVYLDQAHICLTKLIITYLSTVDLRMQAKPDE
jgi:hypothetical protein